MSQPMKFQVTKTVFLQKFIELFGRRVRMHDMTAPVGKEESLLMPFLTEQGFFTVLLFFQFLQNVTKSLWNCYLTNAADRLWKFDFRLLLGKLDNASADIHSPFFKINILPLQTGDLATSGTRINSGGNNGVNMDGFKLSHFENFGNLFVAESLNLRSYDFGYLQAA